MVPLVTLSLKHEVESGEFSALVLERSGAVWFRSGVDSGKFVWLDGVDKSKVHLYVAPGVVACDVSEGHAVLCHADARFVDCPRCRRSSAFAQRSGKLYGLPEVREVFRDKSVEALLDGPTGGSK